MAAWQESYKLLATEMSEKGLDVEAVKMALKAQHIETPSWGYGDGGTRFAVFAQAGAARTPFEKVADAAQVHKFTGVAPSVALHIPWDKLADYAQLKAYAASLGIALGAINPNLFQDEAYKLGSVTNVDPEVRRQAVAHMLECVDIARQTGSDILSIWLADGTNVPGQGHIRTRMHHLVDCLAQVYAAMPRNMRMLVEYKFFEPAFYMTDLGDWGMSMLVCQKLGTRAQVLVDLGHHPLGTNIEQIVALLLDEGRLGGFHFNAKKYGDDDLTVGSINPYELFLIYNELVDGARDPRVKMNVAYMIDESINLKPKIESMIQSVVNVQTAYAQALIVDRAALAEAQRGGNIVAAEEALLAAYRTDVRPLLAQVRVEMGLAPDPLAAYRASGYFEKVCAERQKAATGGAGYPGA